MTRLSDPRERRRAAGYAQLRYVCCADAGIQRKKRGRSFVYLQSFAELLPQLRGRLARDLAEHTRRTGLNADECDLLAVLERLTSARAAA